jgi:hypothetical protein
MTVRQIHTEMKRGGKPVKVAQLYRYFKRFKLHPIGRQRPAQYPNDAASIILRELGFSTGQNGAENGHNGNGRVHIFADKPQKKGKK